MALREFKTREDLQALLDREIAGERRELPDNNLAENALRLALDADYTATTLEIYGYPENDAQYLFFVEYSERLLPNVHVRKPLGGLDLAMLNEAVPLVLEKMRHVISKHGKLLPIGEDDVCNVFLHHLSSFDDGQWRQIFSNECGMFYMTAAQRDTLMKENSYAPAGFSFEPVDVERDGETIHAMWKYGIRVDITKNSLRALPSICARNEKGELVGWAMCSRTGQISNLFVLPEYRGCGLGRPLELALAKEFIRRGLRVYKYVEPSNASVYAGSLRSPNWTLWTTNDEENNDSKSTNAVFYRLFRRDKETD